MTGDEKRAFLTLVAYGIHSTYQKKIRLLLEKDFGIRSFFVYEYLFDPPVIKGFKTGPISAFAPFLLRILNESNFIPKITEIYPDSWTDIEKLPYSYENIAKFWNFSSKGARVTDISKTLRIGKDIFSVWEKDRPEKELEGGWLKKEWESGLVKGNFSYPIDYLRDQYLSEYRKVDDMSKMTILKEYMVSVLPWLSCADIKYLNIATLSVTSKNIFYGYILIFYPPLEDDGDIFHGKNGEESEAIRWLKKFIKESYVPILALFENYWEEKELKEKLDKNTEPDWERDIFLDGNLKESPDSVERGLHILWNERKEIFENHSPGNEAIKKVRNSLLFSKYLIASTVMIDEIKKIILPRRLPEKFRHKDYIPSVLVIGGPGSGKDTIAQMVHLFFPEYRFGDIYTINMASLKPNYLSVPLMSGFEAEITGHIKKDGGLSKVNIDTTIKGIFSKIWDQHKKRYPGEENMERARKNGLMPVVILDELNSLDVDAQGSLLRILQNAAIQSLGAHNEEKVDFLVIGIVNEPEDTLTLEEPLRKFAKEKSIFGGVLGRALYEHFRNMRRLRDDLYYRLVRDGKFTLLDLAERREDIPILFSFFVKNELDNEIGDGIGWDSLWFDFDIFEELMDRVISWSGNFRQLQSLAKRAAYEVLQDKDNQDAHRAIKDGDTNRFIHISMKHVRDVMKEFFDKEV